jgi:hypothetical protein
VHRKRGKTGVLLHYLQMPQILACRERVRPEFVFGRPLALASRIDCERGAKAQTSAPFYQAVD